MSKEFEIFTWALLSSSMTSFFSLLISQTHMNSTSLFPLKNSFLIFWTTADAGLPRGTGQFSISQNTPIGSGSGAVDPWLGDPVKEFLNAKAVNKNKMWEPLKRIHLHAYLSNILFNKLSTKLGKYQAYCIISSLLYIISEKIVALTVTFFILIVVAPRTIYSIHLLSNESQMNQNHHLKGNVIKQK